MRPVGCLHLTQIITALAPHRCCEHDCRLLNVTWLEASQPASQLQAALKCQAGVSRLHKIHSLFRSSVSNHLPAFNDSAVCFVIHVLHAYLIPMTMFFVFFLYKIQINASRRCSCTFKTALTLQFNIKIWSQNGCNLHSLLSTFWSVLDCVTTTHH